jgi:hypothetical protein
VIRRSFFVSSMQIRPEIQDHRHTQALHWGMRKQLGGESLVVFCNIISGVYNAIIYQIFIVGTIRVEIINPLGHLAESAVIPEAASRHYGSRNDYLETVKKHIR